jgi:hypothetical protein
MGPATGEVSGKITLNGQAPKRNDLQIAFLTSKGRLVTAKINEDGTYQALAVSAGEAQVSFLFLPAGMVAAAGGKKRLPPTASREEAPEPKAQGANPIPVALRDGSTSNLKVVVVGGQNNVFNHDLTD